MNQSNGVVYLFCTVAESTKVVRRRRFLDSRPRVLAEPIHVVPTEATKPALVCRGLAGLVVEAPEPIIRLAAA